MCNCDLASPRGHGAAPMEAIRNRKKADDNNLRAEQSAPAVGHSCSRLPSSLSSLYSHCFFASHLSPHPSSISPPSLPHTCFRGLTVWHDHFVDFSFALDIGSGCGSLCSPSSPVSKLGLVLGLGLPLEVDCEIWLTEVLRSDPCRGICIKNSVAKNGNMFIFDVFSAGFLPLSPILSIPFSVFIIIIFLKSNRRRAAIISICSPIDCRLWAVACQIEAML